jgi:hypothetical protein
LPFFSYALLIVLARALCLRRICAKAAKRSSMTQQIVQSEEHRKLILPQNVGIEERCNEVLGKGSDSNSSRSLFSRARDLVNPFAAKNKLARSDGV